jgi:hypothetical protein
MRNFLLIAGFLSLISCGKLIPKTQTYYNLIYTKEDSLLILQKREDFKEESLDRMSFLLEKIGRSFIGSPYKSHTLETGDTESLVINLREFDCTTFVETCLALTTTFKMGGYTFDSYQYILKRIRYRNGYLNGYNSRLHYFTDWITDNSTLGYVKDITKIFDGIPYQKEINFMSNHFEAYSQLANDTTLVEGIRQIENEINKRSYYYIPKEDLYKNELYLEEGWIVAFTTSISGLDVIHTGITVRSGDEIHLLHASSDAGKVIVSDKTLVEYVMKNKLQNGIILLKID